MSLLGLLVVLAAAVSLVAGDGKPCPGAPSMTVETACRNASGTQAMYDMCKDALAGVPDPESDHDVTVYAVDAENAALASVRATQDAAVRLLLYNSSLSGDERGAYLFCEEVYTAAEHDMGVAADKLGVCNLDGLADDYVNGLLAVESCRDRVLNLPASPLYAMVLVDRNKAALAFLLGKLLGI
uniref:Pectinesterase inhibitor domain-containing protein n=1 Tax=Oryza punctata TaxID=4537 RepID=A0A0E0LR47_ORYPU